MTIDANSASSVLPLSTAVEAEIERVFNLGMAKVPRRYRDETGPAMRAALRYAARAFRVTSAHQPHPEAGCTCNLWRYRQDAAAGITPEDRSRPICSPGKHPVSIGWQDIASLKLESVAAQFILMHWRSKKKGTEGHMPIKHACNVSIVTGEVSGYFALDVDGDTGMANLAKMEAEHGALPATPTSISGSGTGRHYLFRSPPGVKLYNSQKRFGWPGSDLDIRGENGQIIVAPSLHKSGGRYRWLPGLSPDEVALADAPAWVIDAAVAASNKSKVETSTAPEMSDNPDEEQRSYQPKGDPIKVDARGFEDILSTIGDEHAGFHGPIFSAMCSWFHPSNNGPDADAGPLKARLRTAIVAAPKRPDRPAAEIERYLSDGYLDEDIESARVYARTLIPKGFADFADAEAACTVTKTTTTAERLALAQRVNASGFDKSEVEVLLGKLKKGSDLTIAALRKAKARTLSNIGDADSGSWPENYGNISGRLCFFRVTDEGTDTVPLCRALQPIATVHDERELGFGKLYEFINPNGTLVSVVIRDAELTAGSDGALFGRLSELGLEIDGDKENKGRLNTCLTRVRIERKIFRATKAGWHGGIFIPGSDPEPANGALRSHMLTEGARFKDRHTGGSLSGWKATAALAFTVPENFHWPIGLMAGFAGPLIGLLGLPSCGVCFSGPSSLGKTTALLLQAAIHGNPRPDQSCLFNMNTTASALENLSVRGHHQTIGFDELALAPAIAVKQMVYQFAEGQGKSRSKATEGENRDMVTWASFGTMTTEKGLREIIESVGQEHLDGLAVRVPDVSVASAIAAPDVANALRLGALANYGHAVGPFIAHLHAAGYVVDPEPLRTRIKAATLSFVGNDPSPLKLRAAQVFAVLGVAGSLAVDAGLISEDADVVDAIDRAWKAYQAGAGAAGLDRKAAVIAGLQRAMAARHGLDIIDLAEGHDLVNRPRSSYFDSGTWYVPEGNLSKLAGCGLPEDAIVSVLDEAGLMLVRRAKDHRLLWSDKSIPGTGVKVPHWRIELEPFKGNKDDIRESSDALDPLESEIGDGASPLEA